ncbi:hypothetical protein [Microtetraspora malaysiensis]|uniref:hypothetical protein n=1 Tax=Microtetraspora malaysiensis TaxID=161358 RepID=UPI003D94291D
MEQLTGQEPMHIGPYRPIARLGKGGMGLVYLGRSDLGRTVAVKVVRPDSGITRFEVRTNVGKIGVKTFGELAGTGQWSGKNAGDRMEVAAVDGSWDITLEGPAEDAWYEAS